MNQLFQQHRIPSRCLRVSAIRFLLASALSTSVPATIMTLKHVPHAKLYASEPNPAWFGNPSNERNNPHWDTSDSKNWLKSRFHFSFAEYSNYANSNFGVLRVMNDDFVQPDRGFGTHGHANMEIITYIMQGKLAHKDNMGTEEELGRGSVQFMTAGRGVRHSEFNHHKDSALRFIQTWIVPRKNNLRPNYGSFDPDGENSKNVCTANNSWRHLVSDVRDGSVDTPVKIEQDANLYTTEMDNGHSLDFELKDNRMAYVLCAEGSAKVRDADGKEVTLRRHDGCEVKKGGKLTLEAIGSEKVENGTDLGAHLLMFEMAHVEGSGRTDF